MDREKIQALSFEDSYDRLDEVIRRLEQGDLSLESAVALYEEGMSLADHCGRQLDDAELRVTQILSAAAEDIASRREES